MTDERLRRNLRLVDAPVRADSAFVDDLHALAGSGARIGPDGGERAQDPPDDPTAGRADGVGSAGWPSPRSSCWRPAPRAGAARTSPGRSRLRRRVRCRRWRPTGALAPTGSAAYRRRRVADPVARTRCAATAWSFSSCATLTDLPRLRVLRPDSASEELLPDQPGLQRRATWNPDGSRIAFGGHDLTDLRSRPLIWETDAEGRSHACFRRDAICRTCSRRTIPATPRTAPDLSSFERELPRATRPRCRWLPSATCRPARSLSWRRRAGH